MTDVQLKELDLEDVEDVDLKESESESEVERIEKIEKDLLCLSDLMSSIRELAMEQQPVIDRIEQNIIETAKNTEEGVEELEAAELYQRNARIKRIKVVSGAVVGGLLFGGVGVMAFGASQALVAAGVGSGAGAFTGFLA